MTEYTFKDLDKLNALVEGKTAEEIIKWAAGTFEGHVTFASSLGQEDQVITDIISRNNVDVPIFTLDTGRLFPETYNLIADTEKRYGVKINLFFPDNQEVEEMVSTKGVNLFYESIENRKQCCRVRKLNPLKRALKPYKAWVCGLRKEQAVTREEVRIIEWDGLHQMFKINPLTDWSMEKMLNYITENDVPYNPLHDHGFLSIGCASCTRAIKPGQHLRDGRWWWESPEQKECGLHWKDGKPVRAKDF